MGNTVSAPYSALTIANYVILYSHSKNIEMNNLKLQKILYFLQGLYLVNYSDKLFNDNIEKWQYGPVVPEVYHAYKDYRSNNIKLVEPEISSKKLNQGIQFKVKNFEQEMIARHDREFIKIIVDTLGNYSAFHLVDVTHGHSAWKTDRNRIIHGVRNITYTLDELLNDFSEL